MTDIIDSLIKKYTSRISFLQKLCDKAKERNDKTNTTRYRHAILELENVIMDLRQINSKY